MKLSLALLTFLRSFTWLHPAAEVAPIDHGRMIAVLISLEGGKWGSIGGAAHISWEAWTDNSRLPYMGAMLESYALPVYRKHLTWIEAQLRGAGAAVTPENIAIVWRRGFSRAKELNFQDEYGRRAQNLWNDAAFKP